MAAVADATVVNLETVVGELPDELAYPGKRFLLQSPPVVADMLDELGVDLVTLGNNHAFDWKDAGVVSTLDALDEAGMPAGRIGAHDGRVAARGARRRGRHVDRCRLDDDGQR